LDIPLYTFLNCVFYEWVKALLCSDGVARVGPHSFATSFPFGATIEMLGAGGERVHDLGKVRAKPLDQISSLLIKIAEMAGGMLKIRLKLGSAIWKAQVEASRNNVSGGVINREMDLTVFCKGSWFLSCRYGESSRSGNRRKAENYGNQPFDITSVFVFLLHTK
jgi:hypothetical protein